MILITRPRDESDQLAKELSKYKLKTCIEPLISFLPCSNLSFENISANYVIGSIRSVDVLEKNFSNFKHILDLGDFYVIGEKVKKKLLSIGLQNVINTFEDSSQLIKFLGQKHFNKNPFIYLCGSVFNIKLIEELKNLGIIVEQKIIYKTVQKKKLSDETTLLIQDEKIDSVVFYSTYTAETFIQLVSNTLIMSKVRNLRYFCLSPGIANILVKSGFKNVVHCERPNQLEMIQLIKNQQNS
tara:strand:+ start:133 stop:855 length:723 start_codon:yes stop_codon:yes gene_type:complete